MIVKTYRLKDRGAAGQDISSWTEDWDKVQNLARGAEGTDRNHLSFFLKKYFPRPPARILDGGCGTGRYVISYRSKGYDITGVDFSEETIRRIKAEMGEDYPVQTADITALPFKDDAFDCYLSGGVMEHFEDGPDRALREAHRVLKKGSGILLMTVPYVNVIRRTRLCISGKRKAGGLFHRVVKKCGVDTDSCPGLLFCEYAFDAGSISFYLENNGFKVKKVYPTDFLWGEIGSLLRRFMVSPRASSGTAPQKTVSAGQMVRAGMGRNNAIRDTMYDLFVTENRERLLYRSTIGKLNHLSGHMVLIVARVLPRTAQGEDVHERK
ncbi:MAG: class I SAM-dependent methyltransferase [Candidatus Omnitrophota bacterium]|nr:class I SAM-dependent methyltransferase [Candidatus Omnitrophota bacterium]